jgi:hypothetical protein
MGLKLNKLAPIVITLPLAVATSTTKKIIEEAGRRWGIKLLHENIRICSKPNPLTPKTLDGRWKFPPHHQYNPYIRLNY